MEKKSLDYLFNPRSIGFVGISSDPTSMMRDMFLKPFIYFEFRGAIYPINPKGGEIHGIKIYSSLGDIPGHVDYVIASLPAQYSIKVIQDCAAKGVKAVHFFSSGFSEIGTEEGKTMETELVKIARDKGVRVIGPNSMGIYCPKSRISYWDEFPKEHGSVGYISQSGGNSIQLVQMASARGILFSKVISYGNACDIDESELLEYMTDDPDTEIIAMYIEGVKDGQRFIETLKKAAKAKPVVILKGGSSNAGSSAAASHTGSLAGSDITWSALCHQLGVIRVFSMEELADLLVTFQFMPVPEGRNVAIVGVGGGASVLSTDDCENNDLTVPPLPPEIRSKILEFTPHVGNILRNPIDSQLIFQDPGGFVNMIKIISDWKGIDIMMALLMSTDVFPSFGDSIMYNLLVNTMLDSCQVSSKPMAAVIQPGIHPDMSREAFAAQQKFVSMGVPVYHSVDKAANAFRKYLEYDRRKRERG